MSLLRNQMPARWRAQWIDPELPHEKDERQPASVLRRRFTLDSTADAVLYITCHGLYEARLNGQRVGDFVLAPGTGDYAKRLTVQAYAVSDLLRQGENEITVTLGDGWYRGSVGIDGLRNYYGADLALLCQLEIGGEPALCSDASWQASQQGPTRENDLQQGESYDARREEITDWHGVSVREHGYDNLTPTESVPIVEQERFEGKVFTAPNGETVIDFGQNLAGYTELRLTAKAGQTITLWHGETLDENGNFTQSNFDPGDRNKNGIPQKLTYLCKEGENVYKPRFTIFGFRYARVETDIDLNGAQFTAVAVYSQMAQTGFFTCGNEDVNRLFLNSLWSMRSNFCDIPTDCPTRERAGWTGDAAAFAPTAVYLMDCYDVLRKWLGECRLAQKEDGLVQNIAPVNNSGSMISNMLQGSAGWGDACVLVPWALYEAYGDKSILEENYDMMSRWLAFTAKRAGKTRPQNLLNPWHKYLVDEGFHFGEWCQPDVDNGAAMKKTMMFGAPEVATAYYYRGALRRHRGKRQKSLPPLLHQKRQYRLRPPVRVCAPHFLRPAGGRGSAEGGGRPQHAGGEKRIPFEHGLSVHAGPVPRTGGERPRGHGLPSAAAERVPLLALRCEEGRHHHLGDLGRRARRRHSTRLSQPLFLRRDHRLALWRGVRHLPEGGSADPPPLPGPCAGPCRGRVALPGGDDPQRLGLAGGQAGLRFHPAHPGGDYPAKRRNTQRGERRAPL